MTNDDVFMQEIDREEYHLTFKRSLIEEVVEEYEEHKTINGCVESAMKDGLRRRRDCTKADSNESEEG